MYNAIYSHKKYGTIYVRSKCKCVYMCRCTVLWGRYAQYFLVFFLSSKYIKRSYKKVYNKYFSVLWSLNNRCHVKSPQVSGYKQHKEHLSTKIIQLFVAKCRHPLFHSFMFLRFRSSSKYIIIKNRLKIYPNNKRNVKLNTTERAIFLLTNNIGWPFFERLAALQSLDRSYYWDVIKAPIPVESNQSVAPSISVTSGVT